MQGLQRILSRVPWGYAGRRVLIAVPTLLAIITVTFFMMRAAPGGPFDSDRKLPAAIERAVAAKFGLDKPIIVQYTDYLSSIVRGDFGPSYKILGKSVNDLIADGLPVSLTIGLLTMLVSLVAGTALGIYSGLRQNSAADYGSMALAMIGISIPTFVIAPILVLIFAIGLGWFPVGGLGVYPDIGMSWHNLFLPVLTLSLPQIAIVSRLMRASIIETMRASHIRTARAKGLSERDVILRHALPVAALPLVSYAGPAMARVMTGSVVVEKIFGLPGMGSYFVNGALNRDYTLVMAAIIIYATLIVFLNLVADVLYAVLDPKVKYDT